MKTRTLKQLLLYNYRYLFAYVIIIGFMMYFLGWQLGTISPGLSAAEITVAGRHTTLHDLILLPVYPLHSLMQFTSIQLLDVTAASLRLPSVIIALLTAVILYNLLKKWFGKQTALLCTALFVSADWFLFIARLGTGSIEFSLWLVLGLFCFTKILEQRTRWLIMLTVTCAALLFTPFGPYVVITLLASLFGFKLFRERTLQSSLWIRITAGAILALGFITTIFASFKNTEFLKNILNIVDLPSITGYLQNVIVNTSAVVAVLPDANPLISPTGIFFVRFFELIFILFGVSMFWKTRVNRLNFAVLILSVILVLASGLSSGSRGGSALLIPAAIYITAGVRHLMHRWKRTFPKNPYARVGAYIPLGILFISTVSLHFFSYFWLWPSQSATMQTFTPDLALVQTELRKPQHANKTCFVETSDTAFQNLLLVDTPSCTPVFPGGETEEYALRIVHPATTIDLSGKALRPLTSEATQNNVRWLVVQ